MRMLLTAIALTVAAPALAQTAAPADSHAEHSAPAGSAPTATSANPHADHDMGGMMDAQAMKAHCDKMKAEGKTMDGCDMHKGSATNADPHAGHEMNSK